MFISIIIQAVILFLKFGFWTKTLKLVTLNVRLLENDNLVDAINSMLKVYAIELPVLEMGRILKNKLSPLRVNQLLTVMMS